MNTTFVLPDESQFITMLEEFLAQPEAQDYCVVALDITHLKLLNELYGRKTGTKILLAIDNKLSQIVTPEMGFAGYFGNDDFMLVLPDDDDVIVDIRNQVQEVIASDFISQNFNLKVGVCSISACPNAIPYELCNYAQITESLNLNMMDGVPRFDPHDLEVARGKLALLEDIKVGIEQNQFAFYLQPKCNSETRTIIGMEALVRWIHPKRGLISPGKFVPVLEQSGLIPSLDKQIWEQVIQTLGRWIKEDKNIVPISINVSIADIQQIDVAKYLFKLCKTYEVPHNMVRVEITESMMAQNMDELKNLTARLQAMGFQIHMDDFGSGYSSLNMLKDTNIDVIKLDMKLIELDKDNIEKGRRIVESVIEMSHQLGLPVVAEGVENQLQLKMLQSLDCIYVQGFKFFKPMPVENAEVLLAQPETKKYWDLSLDSATRNLKEIHFDFVQNVAAHACEILADYLVMFARVNLITGEFELLNRDPALPAPSGGTVGDLQEYATMIAESGIIAPEFEREFKERTNVDRLRSLMLSGSRQRLFTLHTTLGGELEWLTLGFTARKDCSPQNPWCIFFVRRETMSSLPAQALGESFEYDSLTGLYNYEKYKSDLQDIVLENHDRISVAYFDVFGLHEVNNHLGHAAGDRMLEKIGTELRLSFIDSNAYRIGGDEFVVLAPDVPAMEIYMTVAKVRKALRKSDISLSGGVASAEHPRSLKGLIAEAEKRMFENKQKDYAQDGKGRQLRLLNTQLEETIQSQVDVEQAFSMILPNCTGVYVVNMLDDTVRTVRAPEGFLKYADSANASFSFAARKYTEDSILPKYQSIVLDLLDYDTVRSYIWSGRQIKRYYERKDGVCFDLEIYPYSDDRTYKDFALWVFSIVNKAE